MNQNLRPGIAGRENGFWSFSRADVMPYLLCGIVVGAAFGLSRLAIHYQNEGEKELRAVWGHSEISDASTTASADYLFVRALYAALGVFVVALFACFGLLVSRHPATDISVILCVVIFLFTIVALTTRIVG
jgi:hypothetical protein